MKVIKLKNKDYITGYNTGFSLGQQKAQQLTNKLKALKPSNPDLAFAWLKQIKEENKKAEEIIQTLKTEGKIAFFIEGWKEGYKKAFIGEYNKIST